MRIWTLLHGNANKLWGQKNKISWKSINSDKKYTVCTIIALLRVTFYMSPSRSMLIGSPMAYTERIPPYGWELPQDLILRAIICSIFSTVCENEGRILKLSFITYKNMQDFEIKSVHFVSEITKQMILQERQQDHTWLVGIQATICIKKPRTYCLPSCTVKQYKES